MASNELKWPQMKSNSLKWPQMASNGLKLAQMGLTLPASDSGLTLWFCFLVQIV